MQINTSSEHEIKLRVTQNAQAKLLSSMRGKKDSEISDVVRQLKAIFDMGEFDFHPDPTEIITDKYYDTKSLDLFKTQSSLRLRRLNGGVELTAKTLKGREKGQFNREEHTINPKDSASEPSANEIGEVVEKVFPDIVGETLTPMLELFNERRNFNLQRRNEKYRLSIDLFTILNINTGSTSKIISEVEIEAKNEAAVLKLGDIKRNLIEILKTFTYSQDSKYERGIKYFGLDRKWKLPFTWMSGRGLGVIGIVLTIVGIVISIVLYFL